MKAQDWTERLWQTINFWQDKPFEYGVNDCCLFAARCADATSGSSWVEDLESRYHDTRSALRYLKDSGGIEAATTERLGEPVPRLQARRGDVCLVETPDGRALAVCVGASVVVPGASGLITKPLREVIKAWRID